MIAIWLVLGASVIAAYTDVTRRKIPNVLVAAVLAGGIAVQATHGISAVVESLAIFCVAIAAGAIAFSWGIAGGGDMKFLAAAGAALGFPDAVPFLFYTLLAGGVLATVIALRRRAFRSTAANIGMISLSLASGVRPAIQRSRSTDMPYAVAILAGAALVLWANTFALHILRISQ